MENPQGIDFLESSITYPAEVQELIASVFPSEDALQQPNFNVVDHINKLFPTEQSLSTIDDVVADVESKISELDEEIRQSLHSQTHSVQDGEEALEEAQLAITDLFIKIKNIKDRAEQSEQTVKEITRDIKQLDQAKRNLTTSITTLNHLHMLTGGVETLNTLTQKRQYGEAASLLQGILNVMDNFKNYRAIPVVKELGRKVDEIKMTLTQQVFAEFEAAFANKSGARSSMNIPLLSEACLVADALGGNVKFEIMKNFIRNQLTEYHVLFEDSQDAAWLDKIDRRYSWIKRTLMEFDERFKTLFPSSWEVSERLAVEFCYTTNRELGKLMQRRASEIDVKLLLFAIQRTSNFETLLGKRLSGVTLQTNAKNDPKNNAQSPDLDPSNPFYEEVINEMKTAEVQHVPVQNSKPSAKPENLFNGLIAKCFEPYLHIYIESQDRNLAELIGKFQQDFQESQAQLKQAGQGTVTQCEVLPTCADLFVYYKKCMVQCSQLSTGEPMISLTHLFQKYLREYASKLLSNNLPKISTSSSSSSGVTMPANITFSTVTNLIKETTSSLKETYSSDTTRMNVHELCLCCSILCTADYCLETTQQLQDKLRQKVDTDLVSKVDLSTESDTFSTVITSCIQLLVHDLISSCEPAFYAMSKVSWMTVEQVGDQSNYVTSITSHIKQTVPQVRDHLSTARKYFTQFCMKFANNFIPRFVSTLYKCKPIGTVGTEQLLLDTHSLKTLLLQLPSIGSQVSRKAPASYMKIVVKGMTKAEMLLKVVMYPHDPPDAFVANYIKLLSASETDTFQKVLEMKGLRRSVQAPLLDLFWRKQAVPTDMAGHNTNSNAHSNFILGGLADLDSNSRIKKLEKLIKKRL